MYVEDKEDKVFIPQTKNTITANDYNQIKNEIQHAISLAGMEPEKDVIQFPAAVKKLTEQSGAEEMEKIGAAGAVQVAAVQQAGATQKDSVNTAGQTQLSAINTAGAQAVQNAQDAAAIATFKADEAAGSAATASSASSTAVSKANAASESAALAESARTAAQSAQSGAETAKTEAQTSQTQAAGSAAAASGSATTASAYATLAQQAASAVGNLQSIISQLQVEVSKMLGRMNFNAAVSTSVQSSRGVPSTFYSCPVDGYLFIPDSIASSAKATVFVNNIAVSKKEASDNSNSNGVLTLMPLPVSAGDSVGIARSGTGTLNTPLIFVPQK